MTHSPLKVTSPLFTALTLLILSAAGCGGNSQNGTGLHSAEDFTDTVYSPRYASGFSITRAPGMKSTLITVSDPWQGADSVSMRLLILRNGEKAPEGFDGKVIEGDANKIAAMSSTHVAMLDAFGATDMLVAVSGLRYIHNPKVTSRGNFLADIGSESSPDYEGLLHSDPDIVLLYGISAASPMESKLDELGIPYIYIGDYLEQSPLGKAEWTVAIGELTGRRRDAVKAFEAIVPRYTALKQIVSGHNRPGVMINIPYGDSWFMPPTGSYMARLIEDAGATYLCRDNTGNTSLPIDLEKAYLLTSSADVWINAGDFGSINELKAAYPKFSDTKPVVSNNVFTATARTTPGGGNDFYESAVVRPDLVLRDLINIFHPGLLEDSTLTYYRRL